MAGAVGTCFAQQIVFQLVAAIRAEAAAPQLFSGSFRLLFVVLQGGPRQREGHRQHGHAAIVVGTAEVVPPAQLAAQQKGHAQIRAGQRLPGQPTLGAAEARPPPAQPVFPEQPGILLPLCHQLCRRRAAVVQHRKGIGDPPAAVGKIEQIFARANFLGGDMPERVPLPLQLCFLRRRSQSQSIGIELIHPAMGPAVVRAGIALHTADQFFVPYPGHEHLDPGEPYLCPCGMALHKGGAPPVGIFFCLKQGVNVRKMLFQRVSRFLVQFHHKRILRLCFPPGRLAAAGLFFTIPYLPPFLNAIRRLSGGGALCYT